MASFDPAYTRLSANEGGYVKHPRDKGGETYRGVARNSHPKWPGWAKIDRMKKAGATKTTLDADPELKRMVKEFFRDTYWKNFGPIANQSIAMILFDWAVLTRPQLAWDYAKAANKSASSPDGINKLSPREAEKFFNRFKEIREAHHRRRVAEDPDQGVFLDGWLNRNDSFKFSPSGKPEESPSTNWWPLVLAVGAGGLTVVTINHFRK